MVKGIQISYLGKITNINNFISYMDTIKETTLYLTGSRYFGNVSENSDWDFFCYASESFINLLNNLGFSELKTDNEMFQSNYADTGMKIFETVLGDNSIVQIQCYSSEEEVKVKQNAQIFLNLKSNIRQIEDKQERKRIWTLVLSMIDTEYGIKACQRKLSM